MRRPAVVTALALAAAALVPAAAQAADRLVSPGSVDPPFGPERAIGTSLAGLRSAWGPARAVPAPGDPPVAVWPAGLEVTLGNPPARRAFAFTATGAGWHTAAGVRIGTTEAGVRARYGSRLVRVADRRGILGTDHHLMLPAGRFAIGFVLNRQGRVLWIVTADRATVRAELASAGPL